MTLDLFCRIACIILILLIARELYLSSKLPDDKEDAPAVPYVDTSEDMESRMMRFTRTVDLVEELNKPVDLSDLHPPVDLTKDAEFLKAKLTKPTKTRRGSRGKKNQKR